MLITPRLGIRVFVVLGVTFAAGFLIMEFGSRPSAKADSEVPTTTANEPSGATAQQGAKSIAVLAAAPEDATRTAVGSASAGAAKSASIRVNRTIHADVVAIDQPFMVNRLGASQPAGMIYVLKSDLVQKNGGPSPTKDDFRLRDGKRPRPITLRANVGDVLQINFDNWLLPLTVGNSPTQRLSKEKFFVQNTRYAGVHVAGLELVDSINSDGSAVGRNPSAPSPSTPNPNVGSLAPPGASIIYRLYAKATGAFLLTSGADTTVHQLNAGLFGAVNVQPSGAEWYRSQTSRCEMQAATLEHSELRLQSSLRPVEKSVAEEGVTPQNTDTKNTRDPFELKTSQGPGVRAMSETKVYKDVEGRIYSALGHPLINYQSVFKKDECPGAVENKPILSMLEVIPGKSVLPAGKDPWPLANENYQTEINQLDNGFIVFSLRELFNAIGKPLAADASVARVANPNKFSWVVTNPARLTPAPAAAIPETTYLVQGHEVEVKGQNPTLSIYECRLRLVHSDLTAIITGPNSGNFPVSQDIPDFYTNPASPDRRQPYREFTIIYHQGGNVVQAFPQWSNNNLAQMINAGMDQFGINYGFAAIGPEIVANRLGVGPMGNQQQPKTTAGMPRVRPQANQSNDSVDLKYEEFFLSSWCVGDPAMIVDVPANTPNAMVSDPANKSEIVGPIQENPVQFGSFKPLGGARPTKAFYPDDPSNVYHGYMRDHTKMRVLHAGPGPVHVHHLHAHQWLHTPNSPESTYLDSQLILPGSAYTLEITYHGSGNRNQTVGDSIFHCHFYPHFAKGMWSLWRVHDTFEEGTKLDADGVCVTGEPNRALPDGEIAAGTPTPALIPLPTLGMAPIPAPVQLTDLAPWYKKGDGQGRRVKVIPKNWNTILKMFDKNKDFTIDDEEQKTWDAAIETADKYNHEHNLKSGDPGYVENAEAYNTEHRFAPGDKGYIADADKYNAAHNFKATDPAEEKRGYQWLYYVLYDNPGYPFFIPGVGGHRPPHPPMDMAWKEDTEKREKTRWKPETIKEELGFGDADWDQSVFNQPKVIIKDDGTKSVEFPQQYLDGGLPRHLILGGDILAQYQTRWDFTKESIKHDEATGKTVGGLYAFQLPEDGTPIERAAMQAHATRTHKTFLPQNGTPGNFILNGLPPIHGAPYADPSVTDDGNSSGVARRYQAAVIQMDVVLNKVGWHYPQQRFITLWEDVAETTSGDRPPQPFFIRTATNDATELWHTNLVPNYYELDDFQVRTPTDVIGQHIHLVKFDVTASDGAANGWNYEDGTFGPTEVRDRIEGITNTGGLFAFDPRTGFVNADAAEQKQVKVWPVKYAYPSRDGTGNENGLFGTPPAGQDWNGAMTTIQRWAIDPLLNWQGHDRTLRTVFTHDHFGPSTHQQVGLYAGVLVEPQGSQWYLPDGQPMNTRADGGPTSWQAIIVTADPDKTHREYAIEFQDMQLAYKKESTDKVGITGSNKLFKPKLTPTAIAKLPPELSGYDGSEEWAPAAFYIGQNPIPETPTNVAALIQAFATSTTPKKLTDEFRSWFLGYGIQLDPDATVMVLDPANGKPGSFGAQFLIRQPPLNPNAPRINAGDYYILEATNPNPDPTSLGTPLSISVFTPTIAPGFANPANAVNPNPGDSIPEQSNRLESVKTNYGNIGTPKGGVRTLAVSNSTFSNGAPYPSLVSTRANGTYSVNYRNEPVPLRYTSKDVKPWNDLANIFTSPKEITPAAAKLLTYQPKPQLLPPFTPGGAQGTDPFTPLIRGYVGDDIQIRALVGAHLQSHAFTIHGVHWLTEPSDRDSGYRNVQAMGLSEHFEMRFTMPSTVASRKGIVGPDGKPTNVPNGTDYLYSASTDIIGMSNGLWGIMRSYDSVVGKPPTNPLPKEKEWETDYMKPLINNAAPFQVMEFPIPKQCRPYDVVATTAAQALAKRSGGALTYNERAKLSDPDAVMFFRKEDLNADGTVRDTVCIEPLVLRAAAGEWIKVTLTNRFPPQKVTPKMDVAPFNKEHAIWWGNPFNILPQVKGEAKPPLPNIGEVPMFISHQVGLHPQLVAFDVTKSNGINAGFNPITTVGPGNSITYYWYAGNISQKDGKTVETPVEFGATNLIGADLMLQTQFGMVGALIVEPVGSTWTEDDKSRAFATVKKADGSSFRECVLTLQNMVSNLTPGREDQATQTGSNREAGYGAVNYRTEPFSARNIANTAKAVPNRGFANAFSNSQVKAAQPPTEGEPETPIFVAKPGDPVRFRVVMPSTSSANSAAQPLVFAIHGHNWQEEPYISESAAIGDNRMSQTIGSQIVTMTEKYDIVVDSAGGPFRVPGDYLYQAYNQEQKIGVWGIFRVKAP